MPKAIEIADVLRAVLEARDHSDPAAWQAGVAAVLDPVHSSDAWDDQPLPSDERLEQFKKLYLVWKRGVGARDLNIGDAFGRHFWINLADPHTRTRSPVEFSGFPWSDDFANVCVLTLMNEVLRHFQRRELTEAERLNDAGFAHHHAGGYQDAIPLHEQAIGLVPQFALAWVNKGIALKNMHRLDEAIACYDHVLRKIDAEYKKAWQNKAVALRLKGEVSQALECAERALEMDPDYKMAASLRDECYRLLRADQVNVDLEDHTYAPLLELLKSDPQALSLATMATRLQDNGNWGAAARLWGQLDGALSDHAVILVAWGNALFEAGQKDAARAKFQRAVEVDPGHVWAWIDLARCYIDRHEYQEALIAAERATACTPPESMAWANLACALGALERYQEGFEAAERAVGLDDRNPFALYYAGAFLSELGRTQEALQPFQRLLRVHPDHFLARSAREILDSLG